MYLKDMLDERKNASSVSLLCCLLLTIPELLTRVSNVKHSLL